ncbi:L,D-transpeptidase family protein [Petroclostridium sp. X23]|uniref:L,D-transpeptidase family protein n=1 Tax=Petroclostridium sp. X23 TaxID=3045146 RepID=UPI0024AD9272|nr:L,D-transpeptidase family protein [Petroclostridium sp. X23]WHH61487.1 L,D-transpeptidase family protein [Petroclostridium sp. X23]
MKKINPILLIGLILFISAVAFKDIYTKKDYFNWEDEQQSTFLQKNPYEIYIDLSEYRLYLFKDGEVVKKYPVAGGKDATPSPFGVWKVADKGEWGKWFGGHWLGLNVPWGTYGIHGTTRPSSVGRSASHGCIRMFNKNVEELWKIVPQGTPVVITNGPYSPFGLNPRIILPGDRGSDVLHVQMILKKNGFYKGALDGVYGDGMKSAVFAMQKKNGIEPHNEIDKQTLKALGIFRFE